MGALSYERKDVRVAIPEHSHVVSSLASCRDEWVEPHGGRRRGLENPHEQGERDEPHGDRRRGPTEFSDTRDARHGGRRRGPTEFSDTRDARHAGRRRVPNESSDVQHGEVRHLRLRRAHRRGGATCRTAPWRSSGALHARRLFPKSPRDWWIVPGEERLFGRVRAVRRPKCAAARRQQGEAEGFGEEEESKRSRASLPV